jgi:hypothetical protein
MSSPQLPHEWQRPPAEFSLAPFWFWNDALDEAELARQLDDFQAHGVDAFVIHPRVGLPRDTGWMSRKLLDRMRFAIEEARRRGMWVILYDEGMYPSGSSSGQVVAANPAYQCRGLVRIDLDTTAPNSIQQGIRFGADGQPLLTEHQSLIAEVDYQGHRYAIIQRPVLAVIRGLHFLNEDSPEPPEDSPPAIDLLNPDAVRCFIELVYQRYCDEFGEHFGHIVQAIFTDEPMLLGRLQESDIVPGTDGILAHVNDYLGYDFTPHLPALWDDEASQSLRADYERALEHRLEETYYAQLYRWCDQHHIALTGHPAEPDATRHLRYFHIPGQDIVWRQIEPDKPSALEGRQSTQGKAASSMMLHGQRRRNANEFCGAYGADLTFEEMRWLANWLLIRGCNLLIPHAFYYSVRGPRRYERPPDVGPHSPWWDTHFTAFARACRRLCWLNTDSELICHVAILGEHHHLPWRAARACFQNQIDFNYLDIDDLARSSIIRDQAYRALIVDGEVSPAAQRHIDALAGQLTVIHWNEDTAACIDRLKNLLPDSALAAVEAQGLRVRHVRKGGIDWHILFNEESAPITSTLELTNAYWLDPYSDAVTAFAGDVTLAGHELRVLLRNS